MRYAHGFATMIRLSGQTFASPQNFNLKSVTPESGWSMEPSGAIQRKSYVSQPRRLPSSIISHCSAYAGMSRRFSLSEVDAP